MSDNGLNGQWLGEFEGTNPGKIIVNVDELESSYEGVAFLFNNDRTLPPAAAGFSIPEKVHTFEMRTNYITAFDPNTLNIVPVEEIQARFGAFSKYADIKGSLDGDILK